MNESIPKRTRKRKGADDSAGQPQEPKRETERRPREGFPESGRMSPPADEPRRSLEGDFERDAGAREELDELERAEREQRRMFEGQSAPGRRNAEE